MVYQYLVAVNTPELPQSFLELLEKFAPRYPLFGNVYVLHHSTKLTLSQFRQLVEDTLPASVSFYVCIPQEGEHIPSREPLQGPRLSR